MEAIHQNRRGGARVRFPPPLVFVTGLLIGLLLGHVHSFTIALSGFARLIIAAFLLVVGIALIAGAFRWFRRTEQRPEPWLPSPTMILEGPYRFSRNPMYVGMTLIHVAIGLAVGNAWMVLFALPALAVVHFTAVLPEERYLTEKFGDSYLQFKSRVRRYL